MFASVPMSVIPNVRPNVNTVMMKTDSLSARDLISKIWSQRPNRAPLLHDAHIGPVSNIVLFMAIADQITITSLYRRLLHTEEETGIYALHLGSAIRLRRGQRQIEAHPIDATGREQPEAYVFPYGCLVVWGGTDADCELFLSAIIDDTVDLCTTPVVGTMYYRYGSEGLMQRETITLQAHPVGPKTDANVIASDLERFAISSGLGQSVKLGTFESSMRSTIQNTKHLPKQLATTGKSPVSQKDVSRLMGRLFLDRYQYHFNGDLLATPAFILENDKSLSSYKRVEQYFELRERRESLSSQVQVVQDLYNLLADHITHQNSLALEWAITLMIAFEIIITLVTLASETLCSLFGACLIFFTISLFVWIAWRIFRRRHMPAKWNDFIKAFE